MAEQVTVSLAEHWRVYLHGLVQNRRFESVDDAIESSLRLLEATENEDARLARLVKEGERSGDAGLWDLQSFLNEAHELAGKREAA